MRGVCAGLVMVGLLSAAPAGAAEIELVHTKSKESFGSTWLSEVGFRLTGPIVPGDAEAMSEALHAVKPDYALSALLAVTVSLDSPGGSFPAGLELMTLFHDLAIKTVVEDDAECLSACAVAFLGGRGINEASMGYVSRTVHPGGRLGFHAPSLGIDGDGMVPGARLNEAYALALQSIAELTARAEDFSIPNSLLDTIISTPPDEMYTVDLVDDFVRWGIDVPYAQDGWVVDREAMARMCDHVPVWRDGASVLERNASHTSNMGTDDWYPLVRLRQLADGFAEAALPPGDSPRGRDTRYFHTQTVAFEWDEHCIVEIWPFGSLEGTQTFVISLFFTNATPEAQLQAIRQSNTSGPSVSRLMSLPPDYLVSRLPRVPYP